MSRFVFDSFALMALAQGEPAGEQVRKLLEDATKGDHELYMSVVSLGEVMYTTEMRNGLPAAQEMLATIEKTPIQIVDVGREMALQAAAMKAETGMGYADCFVAALAQGLGATAVTGDPDFRKAETVVPIKWLPN